LIIFAFEFPYEFKFISVFTIQLDSTFSYGENFRYWSLTGL